MTDNQIEVDTEKHRIAIINVSRELQTISEIAAKKGKAGHKAALIIQKANENNLKKLDQFDTPNEDIY